MSVSERWVTQADPLGDVEKFIDTQMRPMKVPGKLPVNVEDKGSEDQPQKLVKQYLVKWKSRSYLHCSWYVATIVSRLSPVALGCLVFILNIDCSIRETVFFENVVAQGKKNKK